MDRIELGVSLIVEVNEGPKGKEAVWVLGKK